MPNAVKLTQPLRKVAHTSLDLRGDTAFTDKTGGRNQDECVVEITLAYKPECRKAKGNLSRWKVTGGADFTTKPTFQ